MDHPDQVGRARTLDVGEETGQALGGLITECRPTIDARAATSATTVVVNRVHLWW